jgi:hypothetical protein
MVSKAGSSSVELYRSLNHLTTTSLTTLSTVVSIYLSQYFSAQLLMLAYNTSPLHQFFFYRFSFKTKHNCLAPK